MTTPSIYRQMYFNRYVYFYMSTEIITGGESGTSVPKLSPCYLWQ